MPDNLPLAFRDAVQSFWDTRELQGQTSSGEGQGRNVRGGKQLDGFIATIVDVLTRNGVSRDSIFTDCHIHKTGKKELPGYFRPTKEWDLLVVDGGALLAALELKSQVGPSFGNNFNNRTEEALGSSIDLWTAYRERAFATSPQPWLGYLFLLEDCPRSRSPVRTSEPHFKVFPEFRDASYARRYEIFCRKLVLERRYNAACFLLTNREDAHKERNYVEPAEDLRVEQFLSALMRHCSPRQP